jgi:hypothetical protein
VRLLPDPTKSRGWPPALGTSLLTVDLPADESTKTSSRRPIVAGAEDVVVRQRERPDLESAHRGNGG